jgi:hypothetical protein
MAQFLLSVHSGPAQPGPSQADADGGTPEQVREQQLRSYEQLLALEEEMKAAGGWLFSGRLTGPDMATVVDASGADVVMTDGPYAETKEHLAGFYLVEAGDLDAALGWAARTSAIISRPIEVRPFWDSKQA